MINVVCAVAGHTVLLKGLEVRGLHRFMTLQQTLGIFSLKPLPFPACEQNTTQILHSRCVWNETTTLRLCSEPFMVTNVFLNE